MPITIPLISLLFIDVMGCPLWAWILSTTSGFLLIELNKIIDYTRNKIITK